MSRMHDSQSGGDEPPKIKVTDRRLFDSEGNLREGVVTEEPPAEATDVLTDAAPRHDTPVEAAPEQVAPSTAAPHAAPAPTQSSASPSAEPVPPLKLGEEALMRFVEEQYIGGLLALGAMPEPQTGQIVEDLDLAQVRIEILGMLQERAGDHLPAEAKKGLDDVVYQLRMAYLQKRKVAKL